MLSLYIYKQNTSRMKPIYGTTMAGTQEIFDLWTNGERQRAINLLVTCIAVNKPETQLNNEMMAQGTIEAWIEENFS